MALVGLSRDWFERTWHFDTEVELFPEVIERLRGTPDRLKASVRELANRTGLLVMKHPGYEWSIQENIGHIADLDCLFHGRIDDFLGGAAELRPADGMEQVTTDASHNQRDVDDVLDQVQSARSNLVSRLESLSLTDFSRSSFHTRLNIQMRLVDQCVFQASHDDYHLAVITALKRSGF